MTIPSTARKAGPYLGTGLQTEWPFTFKVFAEGDIAVTITDTDGVESVAVLDTDYSVALNADQDVSPGGTVTYPISGDELETGALLTITGDIDLDQPLDLPGGGNFSPHVIENELDRIVMQLQQIDEVAQRSVRFPVSDDGLNPELPTAALRADKLFSFDADGNPVAIAPAAQSATALQLLLALFSGSTNIGFIQAGISAILRTLQDKSRESISAEDYPTVQDAIDDNPGSDIRLTLAAYTWGNGDEITLGTGQILKGRGKGGTVITYSGTGTPISYISSSGSGTRIYSAGARDFVLIAANAAVGIDCDSLSEGAFDHVTVAGMTGGTGIKLHSSTSGGSVYNRFYDVKAQTCLTGFDLVRDGAGVSSYTNENTFTNCRAQSCTTGINITGGNHNVWSGGSIENNTTGFTISEPATATTQQNVIELTRFESNTADGTIGALVSETLLSENMYVNGDTITDGGSRTSRTGCYGNQHKRSSGLQKAGGSFRYSRTANGGASIPNFVIADESSTNVPVTLELQNGAADLGARSFRTRYGGDAGTIKFGIVAISGKIADLSTTNGPCGSFTCGAAATTTINNTAVTASSLIFVQPANASAGALNGSAQCLFVSARTAATSFAVRTADNTAAAGTETFFYWLVN